MIDHSEDSINEDNNLLIDSLTYSDNNTLLTNNNVNNSPFNITNYLSTDENNYMALHQSNYSSSLTKGRLVGAKNYASAENYVIIESIHRMKAYLYNKDENIWKQIATEVTNSSGHERTATQVAEHFKKMTTAVRYGINELYALHKITYPIKENYDRDDLFNNDKSNFIQRLFDIMTSKNNSKRYYSRNWWSEAVLSKLVDIITNEDIEEYKNNINGNSNSNSNAVNHALSDNNISIINDSNKQLYGIHRPTNILSNGLMFLPKITSDSMTDQYSNNNNSNKRKHEDDIIYADHNIDLLKITAIEESISYTRHLAESLSQNLNVNIEKRLQDIELQIKSLREGLHETIKAIRQLNNSNNNHNNSSNSNL